MSTKNWRILVATLLYLLTITAWDVCCAPAKGPVEIERITIVGTVPCTK